MKIHLLIASAVIMGISGFGQSTELRNTQITPYFILESPPSQNPNSFTVEKPEKHTTLVNGRTTTYIPIGQSGNIYGFVGNPRTYLWAEPDLNSVVFTHRMTGGIEPDGNSRVAYDVSIDGGSTWVNNIQVYDPQLQPCYCTHPARYPQGGILNPVGNQNPDNAFYTYFTPTLDNTNGNWGGHAYGSNILTDTAPPNPSQINLPSENGFWRYIPSAFTVTQDGNAWYVDGNYEGVEYIYNGTLMVGSGEIIGGEIVYDESLMDFMSSGEGINDIKIAFSPDGQIGFICIMSDSQSDPQPYNNYHPILLKTTDGGNTWSDPIHVKMGGYDGIDAIKNYWSDEIIESIEYYGPGFNRDEVYYNMGYHCDIVVDGYGNPHITGLITIATDEGWFIGEGSMATWHVYSDDGGDNWDAQALYDNIFFDGDIGGVPMYNRPYIASDKTGEFLCFSWIDTDLDGAEANTNPNIFFCAYCVTDGFYTEVNNVTELGFHWFSAFFGSLSQYVFGSEDYFDIEIPLVFAEYTIPGDPYGLIQYWYIDGVTIDIPVRGICGGWGGINDNNINFLVSQNSPNPATSHTNITITTKVVGDIHLDVINSFGQVIHAEKVTNNALAYNFILDISSYKSGVYYYKVTIDGKSIAKKMIIN